VIIAAV